MASIIFFEDRTEVVVDVPEVRFEFTNPSRTTRISPREAKKRANGYRENTAETTTSESPVVSTEEPSIQGNLQPAVFDSLEDTSQDSHLYADKFVAFQKMVAEIVEKPGCIQLRSEIRRLPFIRGFSKHLLPDGNPRCLAFHLLQIDAAEYALLEVDTSDGVKSLSTLVLKRQGSVHTTNGSKILQGLELQLMKGSLVWPTMYLKNAFGSSFRRIPHPRTSSSNKALLDPDSICRWADRVHSVLQGM